MARSAEPAAATTRTSSLRTVTPATRCSTTSPTATSTSSAPSLRPTMAAATMSSAWRASSTPTASSTRPPLVLHDPRDGGVRHGEGRAGGRHPLYAPLDRLLLRGRRPAYDPHPGVSRDDLGVCRAFSIGAGQPLFVWPHLCPSGSLWCGGKSVCGAKEEEESPAGGHSPTARGVYQIYKLFVWQSD